MLNASKAKMENTWDLTAQNFSFWNKEGLSIRMEQSLLTKPLFKNQPPKYPNEHKYSNEQVTMIGAWRGS